MPPFHKTGITNARRAAPGEFVAKQQVLMPGRGAILGLLLVAVSLAQAFAAAESSQDDLDEVLVQGSRTQLDQMRQELLQLQQRFYARYNELNTVREFDVRCRFEARTGTRVPRHSCIAVFEDDAKQEEGVEALGILQYMRGYGTAGLLKSSPPVPPAVKIETRRPAFQRHMKEVVSNDPELIGLLREREELSRRYDAVRREVFGLEPRPAP